MADIREQIKRKYGIDIETLNLFSLYKISGPGVTDQELEQAFAKKRKSWNQFLNSPREDKAAQAFTASWIWKIARTSSPSALW